jgi:hypothetical protein
MATKTEHFLEDLRNRLVGRPVYYRRLAGDSLLIYVDCEPGDGKGITIWFEPIWNFRGPQGVLVGSMQAFEAAQTEGGLGALSDLMNVLHEKEVEQVVVDPLSFELSIAFAGGWSIKTFVAHATDGESWHIRDNATGIRLKGAPMGLSIVAVGPKSAGE